MPDFARRKEDCDQAVDPQSHAARRPVEVVSTHHLTRNEPKPQPKPRRYAISIFWDFGFKITRPKRQPAQRAKEAPMDCKD